MLVRQPRPGHPGSEALGTADMELLDWMDEMGIEPGQEIPGL